MAGNIYYIYGIYQDNKLIYIGKTKHFEKLKTNIRPDSKYFISLNKKVSNYLFSHNFNTSPPELRILAEIAENGDHNQAKRAKRAEFSPLF